MKQLKKTFPAEGGKLFLGLDLSTQALKAIIIDNKCRVHYEKTVNYDGDLPDFKTKGGMHRPNDGLTVTSPALMWVAALDLLLERLKEENIPLEKITAISGSGQQHGSVYFRRGASEILRALDPRKSLKSQLNGIFSIKDSPVWMDSSTARECRERDAALGGAKAVARLTGSRSYERFTGNQIAKIVRLFPRKYAETEHIALVSSFLASLLIGGYAPIDVGDGAGMNLMNIFTKRWDKRALDCTAPDLEEKLGPVVAAHKTIGKINGYFVNRYGFAPETLVVAFSGDNPNSLAAFGLDQPGAIAISLGTSDTIFGALSNPKPSAVDGHIFGNPICPNGYMALLCYKNGSLTREFIRNSYAEGSWPVFNFLLNKTPPGNNGIIGFYFREPEITPPVLKPGIHLFDSELFSRIRKSFPAVGRDHALSVVNSIACHAKGVVPPKINGRTGCAALPFEIPMHNVAPEQHVRAVLEGQFLSMRAHCANIGLRAKTIIATGGASVNISILRIMADVFGRNIHTIEQQNSAALGAAMRALHGWKCFLAGKFIPFNKAAAGIEKPEKKASPHPKNHRLYTALLPRYRRLEKLVVNIN